MFRQLQNSQDHQEKKTDGMLKEKFPYGHLIFPLDLTVSTPPASFLDSPPKSSVSSPLETSPQGSFDLISFDDDLNNNGTSQVENENCEPFDRYVKYSGTNLQGLGLGDTEMIRLENTNDFPIEYAFRFEIGNKLPFLFHPHKGLIKPNETAVINCYRKQEVDGCPKQIYIRTRRAGEKSRNQHVVVTID